MLRKITESPRDYPKDKRDLELKINDLLNEYFSVSGEIVTDMRTTGKGGVQSVRVKTKQILDPKSRMALPGINPVDYI